MKIGRITDIHIGAHPEKIIVGHSHQKQRELIDNCEIINAGADYG